MSEGPGDMPQWMRDAVSAALRPDEAAPPSAGTLRNTPEWPLLVEAAVVQSFLPSQLATQSLSADARAAAEKTVLQYAQTVHDPDGTKWSLTQQARRDVLSVALENDSAAVHAAIDSTASTFPDSVSAALRQCLGSTSAPGLPGDLPSLEALRLARGLLTDVKGVSQAGVAELNREIDLRRLLAPFERMVGEVVSGDGSRANQFFGRSRETNRLRNYVGEVAASNLLDRGAGVLASFGRALHGVKPLSVWGIGGVGKTTLIAKFMLDHARAAESRFPFAYLDFDRPTISARNPSGLLSEICSQVASQFPAIATRLDEIRARTEEIGRMGAGNQVASYLFTCQLDLRKVLDEYLAGLESTLEFARPLLIVFDTFEVAQYDPESVGDLADLVSGFSSSTDSGLWPRLRVIISGRQKVTDFGGEVDDLEIGALDREGSILMLLKLTESAGKAIERRDAERLIKEIVRVVGGDSKLGVDPLRLRLIGATFSDPDVHDGAQHVTSLIAELRKPISVTGISGRAWVDGLLIRRVLDHVRDRRVRALSDPGLVVRYITKEVIREVMTVATPDPAKTPQDIGDSVEFDPWRVDDVEAGSILTAFGKEVSLVSPQEGGLRHRQDVRRQMLPLIRVRRPNRYQRINELAFDFFRRRAAEDPKDDASAAEALYHGLLLGLAGDCKGLEVLNLLWRGANFEPRIDIEEFAADADATRFIRAKTGQKLTARDVRHLPRAMQMQWLTSRLPALLADAAAERNLEVIREIAGPDFSGLEGDAPAAAVVARLLYRAGWWEDATQLAWRFLEKADASDFRSPASQKSGSGLSESAADALTSLARTWTTIHAKSGIRLQTTMNVANRVVTGVADPFVQGQLLSFCAICAFRADEKSERVKTFRWLISRFESNADFTAWRQVWRTLRLMVLCGGGDMSRFVQTFVRFSTAFPRDRDALGVIVEFLDSAYMGDPKHNFGRIQGLVDRAHSDPGAFDDLDDLLNRDRVRFAERVFDNPRMIQAVRAVAVYEHSDWHNVMGNALNRALKTDMGDSVRRSLTSAELMPRSVKRVRTSLGRAVVRNAVTAGRFIELARNLAEIRFESPTEEVAPQHVVTIGRALLNWHEALRRFVATAPGQGAGIVA